MHLTRHLPTYAVDTESPESWVYLERVTDAYGGIVIDTRHGLEQLRIDSMQMVGGVAADVHR